MICIFAFKSSKNDPINFHCKCLGKRERTIRGFFVVVNIMPQILLTYLNQPLLNLEYSFKKQVYLFQTWMLQMHTSAYRHTHTHTHNSPYPQMELERMSLQLWWALSESMREIKGRSEMRWLHHPLNWFSLIRVFPTHSSTLKLHTHKAS